MEQKEHLTETGLAKIVAIKASMNKGLSPKLLEYFPNILPVSRPIVKDQEIKDSNWFAGFASGECCFQIKTFKSKTTVGEAVRLEFGIAQHLRDEQLIRSLVQFWGCGDVFVRLNQPAVDFRIQKFSDLIEKVIPFFQKYPILGVKAKDFVDWCKVAEMMQKKTHLTLEGLDQIRKIKVGINTGRKFD